MELSWVEKYRPTKISDIVQQDEVIKVLESTIKKKELPHLLFYGSAGTGKTSTILAIAHQLYGSKIGDYVLELNASDDRGINIVRNKIIAFSKISIGTMDPNYPSPEFKIVILDEADAMTSDAQSCLRQVMETYANITRFCFICNYVNQIIEPVVSRCIKFRFKPLQREAIESHLVKIANFENLKVDDLAIKKIAEVSDGDMRHAIMLLQNLTYIKKFHDVITEKDIIYISNGIDEEKFGNILDVCKKSNVKSLQIYTYKLLRNGYTVKNIMLFLKDKIVNSNILDSDKYKIFLEMCETDKYLSDGADEYIQILNLILFINKILR
jgi:replication factor C subunit 2/4